MGSRHDILFEPLKIGPKTLRNRFYSVPHEPFGIALPWSQARYRAMKAEGGWAAVCTGLAAISPQGDSHPAGRAVRIWDDGDVRALSMMCDQVHEHGALAGIELHHGGVHFQNDVRIPAQAPSQLAGDRIPTVVPKAMEKSDIRRTQEDWAAAARRARSAGFDIVYVYGAHSMLPMQFLSPYYNHRADEYGGSLENRARFWLETLDVVRAAVGEECAIATRMSVDEASVQTVDIDEALSFIRMADHLVDLWDVNVAAISEWGKDALTSRFGGEGHQLVWTGRVREATGKPVVGVSRWTNPDRMCEAIESGRLDIIGAARPAIADPFLPTKIREGRLDDIRECIGSNQCTARITVAHAMACTQNATAGEEYRRGWHPERFTKARNADNDVLVVGAGPAGMECALILAKREMQRVHIVSDEPELGGHLRWLARLPGLGEWARVINYRQIQLDKLPNVQFVPKTRLDLGAVLGYGADLVVLATGARWSANGVNGYTRGPLLDGENPLAHVLTPEQIMVEERRPPTGARVLVYDCEGYLVGAGIAELLAGEGFRVQLVTPLGVISPLSDDALDGGLLRAHLHSCGVSQLDRTVLTRLEPTGAVGLDQFGETIELEADAVVLVTQRLSDDALYLELASSRDALHENGIHGLYRVGDCVAPRLLADVLFDGHRLAQEIDSDDPTLPRPFLREGAFRQRESGVALVG